MQLCKAPSRLTAEFLQREGVRRALAARTLALTRKWNRRLNNPARPQFPSRLAAFCDTRSTKYGQFLVSSCTKNLISYFFKIFSLFFSVHSTFRFVFSRAELFTVQTRLTQALKKINKHAYMRCTRSIEKKLNTNIFLAERGAVVLVPGMLNAFSWRCLWAAGQILCVCAEWILRRKMKIDFSTWTEPQKKVRRYEQLRRETRR